MKWDHKVLIKKYKIRSQDSTTCVTRPTFKFLYPPNIFRMVDGTNFKF